MRGIKIEMIDGRDCISFQGEESYESINRRKKKKIIKRDNDWLV